jgi:RNA polymerase sigma-70 factor, ECF subfamily
MSTVVTTITLLQSLHDPDNHNAWQQFCLRFEPMLVAYARRSGIEERDVPDVVQEVLLAFLTSFRNGRYDPVRGRLKQWVGGIAANQILLALRKRKHPEPQLATTSSGTSPWNLVPDMRTLTDTFDREWEQAILHRCLEEVQIRVEPQTYAAFCRCVLEAAPPKQVADDLGMSLNAVYISKHKVLKLLRQIEKDFSASG